MKEIFLNDNFHVRTDEQQEIINLICDNFPSSGFPKHLLLLDDVVAISSYLGYMSIGYKHWEYEFEYGRKSNRICFYKKSDFSLIYRQDLNYPVNSILKVSDKILLGTGIYGDVPKGELLAFDLCTNNLTTCTGTTNPISILLDKGEYIEICIYYSLGYDEGENRVYKYKKDSDFKINFNSNIPDRVIADDDLENIYDEIENTVTINNLKSIINASH
jgi:hypothetical protein